MLYAEQYVIPHAVSLAVSIVFLLAAWRAVKLGRVLFVALFVWAGCVNGYAAAVAPGVYLDYAPLALLDVYRNFILGAFADHVRLVVWLIAGCQVVIAAGFAAGGRSARLAALAALTFFVAVAPLGVGSGFPTTLVLAAAAGVFARNGVGLPTLAEDLRAPWARLVASLRAARASGRAS